MTWADSLAAPLLATTAAVTLAAAVTALLLRGLRCRAPVVHRVAWCLVLVQGWIFLQVPVPLPGWLVAPVADRSEPTPVVLAQAEPPGIVELSEPPRAAPPAEGFTAAVPLAADWPAPTGDEEAYGPWYGEGELAEVPVPPDPSPASQADLGQEPAGIAAPPVVQSQPAHKAPGPAAEVGRIWPAAVVLVWVGGMVVVAAVGLWRYARFVRGLPEPGAVEPAWAAEWRQVAAPRGATERVTLWPVAAAVGPLLCRLPWGYALILPAPVWSELTPAGRRAVLRHELAHWERSDLVKSLLVRLLALPQWFNPLAWLALRRFDEAAEWACDALAAAETPATEYAGALISIVERTVPSTCGAAAQGSELSQRVRRLILEREEDSIMKRVLVLGIAVALVAFAAIRFERPEGQAADDGAVAVTGETNGEKERNAAGIPLDELLYDGKTFDAWGHEGLRELRPERRAEAIRAMAAFGASGYGEEAVEAILDLAAGLMGIEPISQAVTEGLLPRRARDEGVWYRIDPSHTVGVLRRTLQSERPERVRLGVDLLGRLGEQAGEAADEVFEVASTHQDVEVRLRAADALVQIDPSGKQAESLARHVIAEKNVEFLGRLGMLGVPGANFWHRTGTVLLTEGLASEDEEVRLAVIEDVRQRPVRVITSAILEALLARYREGTPREREAAEAALRRLIQPARVGPGGMYGGYPGMMPGAGMSTFPGGDMGIDSYGGMYGGYDYDSHTDRPALDEAKRLQEMLREIREALGITPQDAAAPGSGYEYPGRRRDPTRYDGGMHSYDDEYEGDWKSDYPGYEGDSYYEGDWKSDYPYPGYEGDSYGPGAASPEEAMEGYGAGPAGSSASLFRNHGDGTFTAYDAEPAGLSAPLFRNHGDGTFTAYDAEPAGSSAPAESRR